jgi:DNA-binding MarR family transcriptional regulator
VIRTTSAESHRINRLEVNGIAQNQILTYLLLNGWNTRRQIAEATGISTATIAGLVRPMLDVDLLEERRDKAKCPISGRNAFFVRVKA